MKGQKTTYNMKRNFIWILAGLMLSGLSGLTSMSLAVEDTWTRKADMPTARYGLSPSGSVVNGKIYVIGGGKDGPFSMVEEYNPATDTWTQKADMPTARAALSTSVVDGKIYAIGGYDGRFLSTVEEYDPATDTWTKKTDMPTARRALSTSVVNGKIYAIGGVKGFAGPSDWVRAVEEYDPATDTWTKRAGMPTARAGLSTSVVNGKIYAFGGTVGAAVEEYDPVTNKWSKRPNMPTPRFSLSTSVANGKIYVIGGSPDWQRAALSTMEMYDPVTDTWTKKADMLTARMKFSTSVVNGKIYAIGGSPMFYIDFPFGVVFSSVEEYDTGFVPTSVEPKGKLATSWGKLKAGY